MSILEIVGEHLEDGERKTFYVNNRTMKTTRKPQEDIEVWPEVDLSQKGKVGPFATIKIQLGLSCNYSCSYCSQRMVKRPPSFSRKRIDKFIEKFKQLPMTEFPKFEFWGGEPMLYYHIMKPLAERLRELYSNARFSTITNGSLLTKRRIDWLYDLGFSIAISHDGPGQSVRGEDPLETKLEVFEYALERLLPQGRLSISSVLNNKNSSRLAIIEYWEKKFPKWFINSSEMEYVDAYDEGGLAAIKFSAAKHQEVRRNLWAELRFNSKVRAHCNTQNNQINEAFQSNTFLETPKAFGQKCGMDKANSIAVDLHGNVITCQNVSSVASTDSGISHVIGQIDDIENIRIPTATHWSKRDHCSTCPVLYFCKGSCMFLEGENWSRSCDMSYSDRIATFAVAFETITGYVPVYVNDDSLPKHRRIIFGTPKEKKKQYRTIPIIQK